jgi:hypothetical protein
LGADAGCADETSGDLANLSKHCSLINDTVISEHFFNSSSKDWLLVMFALNIIKQEIVLKSSNFDFFCIENLNIFSQSYIDLKAVQSKSSRSPHRLINP